MRDKRLKQQRKEKEKDWRIFVLNKNTQEC